MSLKFKHSGWAALIAGSLLALLTLASVLSTPYNRREEQRAFKALEEGDYAAALKQFLPLARQGSSVAQFNLGFMYHEGRGVPRNSTEAFRWYRRAAVLGDPAAQFNLGVMYEMGDGIPQDYKEAIQWYRRSADRGTPNAQLKLGRMYEKGNGIPQDYVQAYAWYSLAEANGSAEASNNRDLIAARMNQMQIAEAQRLAGQWKHLKAR